MKWGGILLLLLFVALLWVVAAVNWVFAYSLNQYGLVPRTSMGLWGIPLMPLLHGSFSHISANTVPLLVLGGLVAVRGAGRLLGVFVGITLLGGGILWLVGRAAVHVGASGLVFGLFGYLVAMGWYERKLVSIIVAIVVVLLYGVSIVSGILPQGGFVSWEGHIAGLIAGVITAGIGRPKR